jgi:hypothetical protein
MMRALGAPQRGQTMPEVVRFAIGLPIVVGRCGRPAGCVPWRLILVEILDNFDKTAFISLSYLNLDLPSG